jgi:hypothetical protein
MVISSYIKSVLMKHGIYVGFGKAKEQKSGNNQLSNNGD